MSGARQQRLAAYRECQRRYRPGRAEFARLVADALDTLPKEFRQHVQNVAVVVEEWPPHVDHEDSEDESGTLLGLYQGTPLAQRGTDYHLVPPDRITVYRGPILAMCFTPEDVAREVRQTVLHEIGHFFGLDEADLP